MNHLVIYHLNKMDKLNHNKSVIDYLTDNAPFEDVDIDNKSTEKSNVGIEKYTNIQFEGLDFEDSDAENNDLFNDGDFKEGDVDLKNFDYSWPDPYIKYCNPMPRNNSQNTSMYTNINYSKFFSKMDQVPISFIDMETFINLHHGMQLFGDYTITRIIKNYDISVLQLDTLFVLCRYIHYHMESMFEAMLNWFEECSKIDVPNHPLFEIISVLKNAEYR